MKSNQPSPVWPFLGVLACLFAIAVYAPRSWEQLTRHGSIEDLLDQSRLHVDEEPILPPASTPAEPVAIQIPKVSRPAVVRRAPSYTVPKIPTERLQAIRSSISAATTRLIGLATPVAQVEPAVETSGELPTNRTLRFAKPEKLFAELAELKREPKLADWTTPATQLLNELCQPTANARSAEAVLEDLRQISKQGESLAVTLDDTRLETPLLRAQHGLARHVDVWQAAVRLSTSERAKPPIGRDERMSGAVQRVESLTDGRPEGSAWREYLLIDKIGRLAKSDGESEPEERQTLARKVLDRLNGSRLSPEQRRFANLSVIVQLRDQLRRWAIAPVDPQTLLDQLARFEQTGASDDGQQLAESCCWLAWSQDPVLQELAGRIEEHYRNANVRVAVASTFVNRFVPQPAVKVSPVRDVIMGADVAGRSATFTQLTARMIPDSSRVRLGLEANGIVASRTSATSGPVTFHNHGESQFIVRKLFVVGPHGLKVWPAMAEAEQTRSDLMGMETDYDSIPLVSNWVRSMAETEHAESQGQAMLETEQRIAIRTRNQFDTEIQPWLDKVQARFTKRVLDPLARLGLEPEPMGMSTTEDRAVVRLRLADSEQLSAYTPRPRAPSDSLVSLQIHESAVNNVLAQLDLDGRSFELGALYKYLGEKLNRPKVELPEDLPENVTVKFADHDAVQVHCDQDLVELRLSFAELSDPRRHWRDFTVRTTYRPDTSSLETRFVREGGIFLEGAGHKGADITLRGIFSKVLSPLRNWNLVDSKLANDPRIKDVEITQFTIDKGWIGLAYAPRRPTGKVARQPK